MGDMAVSWWVDAATQPRAVWTSCVQAATAKQQQDGARKRAYYTNPLISRARQQAKARQAKGVAKGPMTKRMGYLGQLQTRRGT